MKKLATLFSGSFREFGHVSTITIAAFMAAVSIVLTLPTLAFGDYIKIGFATIPAQIVYYLFGPAVGAGFGVAKDVLNYIVKPTGAFFPGFTFSAMLAGMLYGSFFYKQNLTFKRILAAEFVVSLVCNVILGTLWLTILYEKGYLAILPMRALKNLIMWPINSGIFYTVVKILETSGIFRVVRDLKVYGRAAAK